MFIDAIRNNVVRKILTDCEGRVGSIGTLHGKYVPIARAESDGVIGVDDVIGSLSNKIQGSLLLVD